MHKLKRPAATKSRDAFRFAGKQRDAAAIDWARAPLKRLVDTGKPRFNEGGNPRCFRDEEVEYMLSLVRFSPGDFQSIEMLRPIFTKALNTLEQCFEELSLGHLFDRIACKIMTISAETVLKLLVRCKLMLLCRGAMVEILSRIGERETAMKELNHFVLSANSRKLPERDRLLSEKVAILNGMTTDVVDKIRTLLGHKTKIFGKVFIYDHMDYLKVVVHEMRQLREILGAFSIRVPNAEGQVQPGYVAPIIE